MTQTFRVWAPWPKKVELQAGPDRFAMTAEAGGWWTAAIARPEGEYGFIFDGQGPWPDPRSPWQPRGIHGLSRPVDHGEFPWTDAGWQAPPLAAGVVYELHTGTFTPQGTFAGVIEKLDHLAGLGVTHVELMPVNEFSGARGWGYDGADLFAPHHAYGGPDGLKRLVDACHARGLAVLLDVVYNHFGPAGCHFDKYAPYWSGRYASPWGKGINFDDVESGEVRRFFCDNALMWLRDYHFDGLRLDAVHGIVDTSAIPFLEQLAAEVKQLQARLDRRLVLIPESDLNDPRLLWGPERGGYGLDAQWSDDFHHALHAVLTGEKNGYYADFGSLADLAKALRNVYVYDGVYSRFRRRPHGRPPEGLDGNRFLGYLQNHDQVGNRARGERSSRLMSAGRLKIGAALVLTSPFIPLLFQGEEWGATTPFLYFTDHEDPELSEATRQGRRREFAAFGWDPEDVPDPQAPETFARCKLNWAKCRASPHAEMLDWHRRLIALRRAEPVLRDGRLDCVQTQFDELEHWFVFRRGPFVVAFNLGESPKTVPLPDGHPRVLLASSPAQNKPDVLPPDAVAVMKLD